MGLSRRVAVAGKTAALIVDELPGDSAALKNIETGDTIKGTEPLYGERLRPQFHFPRNAAGST